SIANNNLIDWRVSKDSDIRNAFISDLRGSSHFLDAEYTQQLAPYSIRPVELPQVLPVQGVIAVSLKVKAATLCDLVIDILDRDFQWQGGTRVSVDASTQIATASFRLNSALTDRTSYRWSIFLTPPGGNYLSALAWYYGPHPSADPDSDGADNEQEVVAGTSPRDPLDVLSLGIDLNRPRPVITWNSKVGCRYHLFTSIDMRSWTPASEFITGTGERISIAPPPTAPSRAFYRLEVVRP
ncbi:MAG: hypothetical protein ACXW3L_03220, partial [Limisphaerales bacterium]